MRAAIMNADIPENEQQDQEDRAKRSAAAQARMAAMIDTAREMGEKEMLSSFEDEQEKEQRIKRGREAQAKIIERGLKVAAEARAEVRGASFQREEEKEKNEFLADVNEMKNKNTQDDSVEVIHVTLGDKKRRSEAVLTSCSATSPPVDEVVFVCVTPPPSKAKETFLFKNLEIFE